MDASERYSTHACWNVPGQLGWSIRE